MDRFRSKRSKKTKEERFRESLELDTENISVFPKIKEKKDNTIWTLAVVTAFIVITIIFNSLFSIARVSGASMDSTLHDGQYILLAKHEDVQRFDVVVLREQLSDKSESKMVVKRVIGMPGDVVTVIDGTLYINSNKYKEPYLDEDKITNYKTVDWTVTVPKGYYFVLGDNRDISKDSRTVGSFKKGSVMGVRISGEDVNYEDK